MESAKYIDCWLYTHISLPVELLATYVVIVSDLDVFKRGLNRFLEDKSITLLAKIIFCNLLVLEGGYPRMSDTGNGNRTQVSCLLPIASGGPL